MATNSPETIMMIHGMCAGGWCWADFRNFFKGKGYHCLSPTLRHHDVAPQDEPPAELGTTSLKDYATDLEDEIRKLNRPPILMGHSMGGLLAQILASRGLARAIILICPAPPAGILVLKPSVIRSFSSALTRWEFWRRPFKISYDEAVYSVLELVPEEDRRTVYNRFVHESGRAAMEIGFWPIDRNKASRVDENMVRCPVLVIGAGKDRMTPAATVRKVAVKYNSAAYKEFISQTHWLIAEPGWQDVAEYIAGWLPGALSEETAAL